MQRQIQNKIRYYDVTKIEHYSSTSTWIVFEQKGQTLGPEPWFNKYAGSKQTAQSVTQMEREEWITIVL